LNSLPKLGVAGIAGISKKGKTHEERKRGYISDCGENWGKPIKKPEDVQILDECVLIVSKSVFTQLKFDEKIFDGWHCYGADYCLSVKQKGFKNYVLPLFIYHRSLRSNVNRLVKYQKRLYKKHKQNYKKIYTTTTPGEISWQKLQLYSLINTFKPIYDKLFLRWTEYLKKEISDDDTVLDLGCGYNSPIQYCNPLYSTGVEKFGPYLQESKKKGIHNKYINEDITKIEFKPKSFDVVLCSEVIEHLTKEEGIKLIKKMKVWARKKIIITVPNGFLPQDTFDDNNLQEHKCGWNIEELKKMGFKVHGIHGWKKLKGPKGVVKYKPYLLWIIFSNLTQKITYYCPNQAFQLFAVKQNKDNKK